MPRIKNMPDAQRRILDLGPIGLAGLSLCGTAVPHVQIATLSIQTSDKCNPIVLFMKVKRLPS
jgi:hypothetical protein